MSYVAATQIAEAKRWVGFREGPNNANPFSQWQYGSSQQPWCASFTAYCAYRAGFRFPAYCTYGERGDSWVTAVRRNAMRQGIWRARTVTARPGWLVIFEFTQPDQHIEMVISDQGQSVATIGGNTGNSVAYRVRSRRNVVGFVALDQAGQSAPPAPVPPPIVWKVQPMYNPPINVLGGIRASLPLGGGELLAGPMGHLYALDGAPNRGGPIDSNGNPKPYWGNRQVARLELPNAAEKAAGKVYTVVANDGNRYAYPE